MTGSERTFSTAFSRAHGLEPEVGAMPVGDDDDDAIESYLAGLRSADPPPDRRVATRTQVTPRLEIHGKTPF